MIALQKKIKINKNHETILLKFSTKIYYIQGVPKFPPGFGRFIKRNILQIQ